MCSLFAIEGSLCSLWADDWINGINAANLRLKTRNSLIFLIWVLYLSVNSILQNSVTVLWISFRDRKFHPHIQISYFKHCKSKVFLSTDDKYFNGNYIYIYTKNILYIKIKKDSFKLYRANKKSGYPLYILNCYYQLIYYSL